MFQKFLCAITFGLAFLSACTSVPQAPQTITSSDGAFNLNQQLNDFTDFILVKTDGVDGPEIASLENALDDLIQYDVVFIGESHGHIGNHILQSKVFAGLQRRYPQMSLSMEQFERDSQAKLDQYLASEIGEAVLTADSVGWSHYKQSYRPMVETAKRNKLPVLAANAPAAAVRCMGMSGPAFLGTLSDEKRKLVARELNTQDGAYKDKYYAFLEQSMSHGKPSEDDEAAKEEKLFKSFSGQVLRDDTMAETIADHMKANPKRKVMHTNGSFHSAELLGTPERLALRLPGVKMANIHPIEVADPTKLNFSSDDLSQGQYLAIITEQPKQYVQMENMMAFYQKTGTTMKTRECAF